MDWMDKSRNFVIMFNERTINSSKVGRKLIPTKIEPDFEHQSIDLRV